MALTQLERAAAESSFSPTATMTSVSGSSRSQSSAIVLEPVVAGLRRREADLDDLARREQRQIVGAGEQLSPAEAAVGRVQLAAREARAHRRGAHVLERLVDEQRLVAGDEIHLGQTIGEMALELAERNFQNDLRPTRLRVAGAAWLDPRAARGCRRARDR